VVYWSEQSRRLAALYPIGKSDAWARREIMAQVAPDFERGRVMLAYQIMRLARAVWDARDPTTLAEVLAGGKDAP
jgi:hypothetical protein